MTKFESNAAVQTGYYFNPVTMNVALVSRDGERLPNEKGTWFAIPAIAALALTPLLGALFLMFLPAIGFALCAEAAGHKMAEAFRGTASDLAATVSPGWAPGEAHFTGKRTAETKAGSPTQDDRLAALEKEIQERRGH
jgi:hypothetical protein